MRLFINSVYEQVKPVALTNKSGLEGTIINYQDAITCLNLLSSTEEKRPLTAQELKYQEACILYMYDIIDTLLSRLTHSETERFNK